DRRDAVADAAARRGPGLQEAADRGGLLDLSVDDRHQAPLSLRSKRPTIVRAETLTRIVRTKSTTPRPMRAERCRGPDSPNWLAMTAAMASPGAKRFAVICALAPMTRASAMVSPMARPRPSMTAPTMPPRLQGITAERIISQRVVPIA